jgi:hypothetical protein
MFALMENPCVFFVMLVEAGGFVATFLGTGLLLWAIKLKEIAKINMEVKMKRIGSSLYKIIIYVRKCKYVADLTSVNLTF